MNSWMAAMNAVAATPKKMPLALCDCSSSAALRASILSGRTVVVPAADMPFSGFHDQLKWSSCVVWWQPAKVREVAAGLEVSENGHLRCGRGRDCAGP
jgi:hypothetical protein